MMLSTQGAMASRNIYITTTSAHLFSEGLRLSMSVVKASVGEVYIMLLTDLAQLVDEMMQALL